MTSPSFTTAELSARLGAKLAGDGAIRITGLAGTAEAKAGDLTFIAKPKYAAQWPACKATAAVIGEDVQVEADGRPLLTVKNVEHAMIALLELFAPAIDLPDVGVHSTAIVHPAARIGKNVRIASHVTIARDAVIADDVVIFSGVCIYANASIGERTVLHANVVVRERSVIGRDVIIHANASIGSDGFGYRPAADGKVLVKMPHIGNVVIEDEVEIGAGTTVDRAKFGSTVIGRGTKIDNLCQVAHNVRLGRWCVVAAQSGFAGSAVAGDGTMVGGQVAVVEHVTIGNNAMIGGKSGVLDDVADGERVLGVPAENARETLRNWAYIRKLPALFREVAQLQRGQQAPGGHKAD